MKCSRCASELADTATVCPQCGTGVTVGKSATFSYLPPNTPSWPVSVPHFVSQHATGNNSEYNHIPVSPYPSAPQKQSKRSAGSIIGSIVLLILAPLLGIAITYAVLYNNGELPSQVTSSLNSTSSNSGSSGSTGVSPTPTTTTPATLPTPTGFKTASDNNVNMSVKYPSDWTASAATQTTDGFAFAIVSEQTLSINVEVSHLSDSVSTSISSADQLTTAYIDSLKSTQGLNNIQSVASQNASPTIAGTKWVAKDATYEDPNATTVHFTTIAVQHGKSYYLIFYFIPNQIYQGAMQKYITPMLNSVKFLS